MTTPTRILTRSDSSQLRLTFLPTIGNAGGLDVRVFRKSPGEDGDMDSFHPTQAGVVVGREQLREFAGMLLEIATELEA